MANIQFVLLDTSPSTLEIPSVYDALILGDTDGKTVNLQTGARATGLDANTTVNLIGVASGSVTVERDGTTIEIKDGSGNVLVKIAASSTESSTLKFSNGSATLAVSGSEITFGGEALATDGATVNGSSLTVDTSDPAGGGSGGGSGTGQTFTLTTAANNFTGGTGDDAFNAGLTAAAGATLQPIDVLDGGAGTDVLNTTANNAGGDILGGALVQNIETINVRATADGTLDASSTPGLTTINANLGTSKLEATNLAKDAVVAVTGNGTVANGQVDFAYATATDAVTLNLAGGTKMTAGITATGTATTATINSTGAANTVGTVDLANQTLTSVTINAASNLKGDLLSQGTDQVGTNGAVTISGAATEVEFTAALDNTIKSMDASGLTAGGVKATVGTGTEDYKGGAGVDTITLNTGVKTATFGAGNDAVTTAAVNTTTAGAISAGDGSDTLVVANTAHVDTTTERAVYTGFEVLQNNTTAGIAASGFAGITSVVTNGDAGGFTGLNATQAGAVTNKVDQTGVTYALADASGTSDALTITAQNSTSTSSADLASLTVNGFESLTVNSSSGATDAGTVAAATAAANIVSFTAATDLTSISLAGAFGVNLILDNTAKAVTVSNSLSGTADMRVEGEVVKGSTITTTANADAIETAVVAVAGASGDFVTYNAAGGNDAISTTLAAVNNTNNGQASLKINGGEGTDTLTFAAADATFGDARFQHITGIEEVTLQNTTALDFTSGGFFDNNFKSAGVKLSTGTTADNATHTVDLASFTGNAEVVSTIAGQGVGGDTVSVTTGTGNDDVTVTAGSWVGQAGAAADITVATGAGADKLSLTISDLLATTSGNIVVNGGTGADTITVSHTNDTTVTALISFTVADGASTAAARDKITGFLKADGTDRSDVLDFGTANVAGNTAGANGTDSGDIRSHAISNGIITFDDVDTFAAAINVNEANLSSVLTYVATNISTAGDTVAFAYDSSGDGSADATMVFNQGAQDSVVELVGVTGVTAIGASAVTANLVAIG